MNAADDEFDPERQHWVWKHLADRVRSDTTDQASSGGASADGAEAEDAWLEAIDTDELTEAVAALEATASESDADRLGEPDIEAMVQAATARPVPRGPVLHGPGSIPAESADPDRPSRWRRVRIGAAALLLVAAGVRIVRTIDPENPTSPADQTSVEYHTDRMTLAEGSYSDRLDSMFHLLNRVGDSMADLPKVSTMRPDLAPLVEDSLEYLRCVAEGSVVHANVSAIGDRLQDRMEALIQDDFDPMQAEVLVLTLTEDCAQAISRVRAIDFSTLEGVEEEATAKIARANLVRGVLLGRLVNPQED